MAYDCYHFLTPLAKAEVEARLLAGEGNAAIADRCTIPAKVVRVYHDLFYDVRPHLSNDVFIIRRALSWWPESGDVDPVGALKLFGYSLGGRAVDALLSYVINPPGGEARAGGTSSMPSQKALWEQAPVAVRWSASVAQRGLE